jgi:hypothetical protein
LLSGDPPQPVQPASVPWPSTKRPASDGPDRWPALPDDRTLWTAPVTAFAEERVRRLDDEQRGV